MGFFIAKIYLFHVWLVSQMEQKTQQLIQQSYSRNALFPSSLLKIDKIVHVLFYQISIGIPTNYEILQISTNYISRYYSLKFSIFDGII